MKPQLMVASFSLRSVHPYFRSFQPFFVPVYLQFVSGSVLGNISVRTCVEFDDA